MEEKIKETGERQGNNKECQDVGQKEEEESLTKTKARYMEM